MTVTFNANNHTYQNTVTKEYYISVTTFLGKYKKPFDKDKWSKVTALRNGVTQEFVLNTWADITSTSLTKGTNYHLVMENFVKDKIKPFEYSTLIDSFTEKMKLILDDKSTVESEKLLFDHDARLAGTADLIINNKKSFYVVDFKTNKNFNFTNKYNEFLLSPVDYLPQCEFSTYGLQLSMYAYMPETLYNKPCAGLKIFYLNKKDDIETWTEINIPYMRSTIIDLIKDRKQQLQKNNNN